MLHSYCASVARLLLHVRHLKCRIDVQLQHRADVSPRTKLFQGPVLMFTLQSTSN